MAGILQLMVGFVPEVEEKYLQSKVIYIVVNGWSSSRVGGIPSVFYCMTTTETQFMLKAALAWEH